MFDPSYLIFGLAILSLILFQINLRLASPPLAILNRWLRLLVFSTGSALVAQEYGWQHRPYWMLVLGFVLVWLLGETLYNWLAIKALSLSPLAIFPKYSLNASGEEWPTHPRLLKVRDWLRAQQFKPVQSLKSEVAPGIYLRVSVFQDESASLRLQITFLPQPNGTIAASYSFSSQAASGYRYVTDNLYIPFGGFYPENWLLSRHPWQRSLPQLLARHRARLAKAREILLPWTTEPLHDLNALQRELDQVNTEMGFLLPHQERDDFGKISYEGRYRVWKEIFLLNYFGRSARYQ